VSLFIDRLPSTDRGLTTTGVPAARRRGVVCICVPFVFCPPSGPGWGAAPASQVSLPGAGSPAGSVPSRTAIKPGSCLDPNGLRARESPRVVPARRSFAAGQHAAPPLVAQAEAADNGCEQVVWPLMPWDAATSKRMAE